MIDDILNIAQRGCEKYKFNDDVVVTLREMSVSQQFKWDEIKKESNDDIEELYINLIVMCCDELKDAPLEKVRNISPHHIVAMGNAIVGLSGGGEKKD
jgi:hypothetical protein